MRCGRGPQRGVSHEQMRELFRVFHDMIGNRNAYYLDQQIIRPLTEKHKISYAELVGCGHLDFFVSHFWGTPYAHFTDTIGYHTTNSSVHSEDAEPRYWVCFMANCQWSIKEELGSGDWTQSSFYLALMHPTCRATCMVLDADALPLTRVWCLFEVVQTFKRSGLSSGREGGNAESGGAAEFAFEGLLFCTNRGVIGKNNAKACYDISCELAHRLTALKLEEAQASNAEDKKMIFDLVTNEMGGFDELNEFMHLKMASTLGQVQDEFNTRIDTLKNSLSGRAKRDSSHLIMIV